MKRHLVFPLDFDSRALTLEPPGEQWEEEPKKLHAENQRRLIEHLAFELGPMELDAKLTNFKDAGLAPFSIVAHHNVLYHQVRYAFIHGYYYPSLLACCALGERILNHLLLDLRSYFKTSTLYKKVHRKDSFDDWEFCVAALEGWGVFQVDTVASNFRELGQMRHKAIHFNPATVQSLRGDALTALRLLGQIIGSQFGFAGRQKWMLPGTRGAFFVKKDRESDPFLRTYYIPQCPYVGPYYAMTYASGHWIVLDREEYEGGEISDQEFADLYESRTPEMLVPSELPPAPGVRIVFRF